MTRARFAIPLLVACSVFAAPHAAAQDSSSQRRPLDGEVIGSEAFLGAHPDLKYRLLGLQHYGKGDWARALEDFRRAARYGDKPAQGMIGEMHWNGEGVAVDRALAYAWMDIAAERAYPLLLAKREHYWAELDESERAPSRPAPRCTRNSATRRPSPASSACSARRAGTRPAAASVRSAAS